MDNRMVAGAILLVVFLLTSSIYAVLSFTGGTDENQRDWVMVDPLMQDEEHDHRNATEHEFSTPNIEFTDFNELTEPGNAEIQVADSPDGHTYAYIAGWKELHIVDVTDPTNTSVVGVYYDPNTQVLDVKYLEYNGRE